MEVRIGVASEKGRRSGAQGQSKESYASSQSEMARRLTARTIEVSVQGFISVIIYNCIAKKRLMIGQWANDCPSRSDFTNVRTD